MKKVLILFLLLLTIFLIFPEIDIAFTSLFYDGTFYLSYNNFVYFIHKGVKPAMIIFTILLIILLIRNSIKDNLFFSKKEIIYLLIVLIVGPILVVNLIFKENSGRVRPRHTIYFGGEKNFTPPFIFSKNCKTNCSFVCGHASAGFYFLAFIPLVRRKKLMATLALTLGFTIGAVRIVQGSHFLSDVIFSAFFVYFSYKLVYYLMFKLKQSNKSPKKSYLIEI